MKAADIPDETFLGIVREFNEGRVPRRTLGAGWEWLDRIATDARPAQMWDLEERLPDVPTKVLRAKADKLIRRGLLDGCACGCRGDFETL